MKDIEHILSECQNEYNQNPHEFLSDTIKVMTLAIKQYISTKSEEDLVTLKGICFINDKLFERLIPTNIKG